MIRSLKNGDTLFRFSALTLAPFLINNFDTSNMCKSDQNFDILKKKNWPDYPD